MSIIWKDGKPHDTLWDMYVEDFEDYMREPTTEERQAIDEVIKKYPNQLELTFYDYLDKALEEDDFAVSERPATLSISKIKNGSTLTIGDKFAKTQLKADQHFNWFQKLMWKWCFGVKVEDYSEE